MSQFKTMPLGVSVYRENENPIFGEGVTHIMIEDEAAGPFIILKQYTDEGTMEIKLDFNEVDSVFDAIKKLEKECKYETNR